MKASKFWMITLLGAGAGFIIGLGIGKETNEAASNNTETSYDSGIVTVKLNVFKSLSNGISNYFS